MTLKHSLQLIHLYKTGGKSRLPLEAGHILQHWEGLGEPVRPGVILVRSRVPAVYREAYTLLNAAFSAFEACTRPDCSLYHCVCSPMHSAIAYLAVPYCDISTAFHVMSALTT